MGGRSQARGAQSAVARRPIARGHAHTPENRRAAPSAPAERRWGGRHLDCTNVVKRDHQRFKGRRRRFACHRARLPKSHEQLMSWVWLPRPPFLKNKNTKFVARNRKKRTANGTGDNCLTGEPRAEAGHDAALRIANARAALGPHAVAAERAGTACGHAEEGCRRQGQGEGGEG